MSKRRRSSSGRKLQLKARANRQEQTRARIVRAALELHERQGPLRTSISAIARRAGVERLTLYRHFPDEPSLFAACTEEYFTRHPPPDPSSWLAIPDLLDRLGHGLRELYAYWSETEPMIAAVLRDFEADPERVGTGTQDYMDGVAATLRRDWPSTRGRGRRRQLRAAIGHAVDFRTWRSLVREQGLTRDQAVRLMVSLVKVAAKPSIIDA